MPAPCDSAARAGRRERHEQRLSTEETGTSWRRSARDKLVVHRGMSHAKSCKERWLALLNSALWEPCRLSRRIGRLISRLISEPNPSLFCKMTISDVANGRTRGTAALARSR